MKYEVGDDVKVRGYTGHIVKINPKRTKRDWNPATKHYIYTNTPYRVLIPDLMSDWPPYDGGYAWYTEKELKRMT